MLPFLMFLASLEACNPGTMKNGYGQQCVWHAETREMYMAYMPTKWGLWPLGYKCPDWFEIESGTCINRTLVARQ